MNVIRLEIDDYTEHHTLPKGMTHKQFVEWYVEADFSKPIKIDYRDGIVRIDFSLIEGSQYAKVSLFKEYSYFERIKEKQ